MQESTGRLGRWASSGRLTGGEEGGGGGEGLGGVRWGCGAGGEAGWRLGVGPHCLTEAGRPRGGVPGLEGRAARAWTGSGWRPEWRRTGAEELPAERGGASGSRRWGGGKG